MKLLVASLILAAAPLAQAYSYRCETRSAGRYFEETRSYENDAREAVLRECSFAASTTLSECADHVLCMATDGGYSRDNGGLGFPRRDSSGAIVVIPRRDSSGAIVIPRTGNGQPTPSGSLCYVRQTSQWVDGNRFFSLAHDWANNHNTCVVAKITAVPYSGRIYDRDGRRIGTKSSGLSNSEVDSTLRLYGLYGCEQFSCTAL